MRYATLDNGTPDGQLALVAQDGASCRIATGLTLQVLLDGAEPGETGPEQPFNETNCLSPLPRAYQFLDGSAYVNHVDLVRRARGAEMPERFWHDPLMYQGGSDGFLSPTAPITGDADWGMDFEAEVAVITGPVQRGASVDEAREAIRLVMLCNDISLRGLIPDELVKGFGFVQSKPACAFSPIAITPDELPGWDGGKLGGTMFVDLNGAPFGRADAGVDMTFDFPTLIAHAAKTRDLAAGTIIGSGTVSNRDPDGNPGTPVSAGGRGYSCIAEQRMVETLLKGQPETSFLQPGDRVKIWMEDTDSRPLFGTIDQTVEALK